jgi:hypothetical protein
LEASIAAGLIDSVEIGPCDNAMCLAGFSDGQRVRDDINEFGSLTYLKTCDCPPPCVEVADLYKERLAAGKKSVTGKALKLVYNSMYGKFAQTIGDPPFGNFIYASRITSGCRTMILNAIATHPGKSSAVVMIATDGVYFTSPHPTLEVSKDQLGKWDCEEKRNLTIFKPGVYWDDSTRLDIRNGSAAKFKARGVNPRYFSAAIDDIDRQFGEWNGSYPATDDDWPAQRIKVTFSMVTARQALLRNNWELAGKVTEGHTQQDSNPRFKRGSGYFDGTLYRSTPREIPLPFLIEHGIATMPYHKNYSTAYEDEHEYDGTGLGVTPDGVAFDLITDVITGE